MVEIAAPIRPILLNYSPNLTCSLTPFLPHFIQSNLEGHTTYFDWFLIEVNVFRLSFTGFSGWRIFFLKFSNLEQGWIFVFISLGTQGKGFGNLSFRERFFERYISGFENLSKMGRNFSLFVVLMIFNVIFFL